MAGTAKIKCLKGAWAIRMPLTGAKDFTVEFKKENDFIAEVPAGKEYVFKDHLGKEKSVPINIAQNLLDCYPEFVELVEVIEEPAVKTKLVVPRVPKVPADKRKQKEEVE